MRTTDYNIRQRILREAIIARLGQNRFSRYKIRLNRQKIFNRLRIWRINHESGINGTA